MTATRSTGLVYTRVSKLDEKDRARALSPEMQLEQCRELPALHGLKIEHYEDLDYSGKDTKRPGYQAMVERIRQEDVAIVAAYSLSRISRSVRDFYTFHEEVLKPAGVAFVSATESLDTSTPQGRAFMGMTAVWAQMERELTSERIRDSIAQKTSNGGIVGPIPAGYRRGAEGPEIDEETAPLIRRIFGDYATGQYSYESLARQLNEDREVPPRSPDLLEQRPLSQLFSGEIVRGVLANVRYAGYVVGPDRKLVDGSHPAVVSKDVWQACVRVRRLGHRSWLRQPSPWRAAYTLTKILRCPNCGGPMRGDARRSRKAGPLYSYYLCVRHKQDPRVCGQPRLRADQLDDGVRTVMANITVPEELVAAFDEQAVSPSPSRRKASVQSLEDRIRRLDERYDLGFIERDAYETERRQRMGEIDVLRAQPHQGKLSRQRETLATLTDDWDVIAPETRRSLVASVFEWIRPTESGGLQAQVRPGWLDYTERALCEPVCRLSRPRGSNPEPVVYKTTALPLS